MLLALRNGGTMIFTAKFSYLGDFWYKDVLSNLEKQGRIQLVQTEEFFQFDEMKQSVGKFTKTPAKIFAYRKTEEDSVRAYAMQNIQAKLQKEMAKKFSSFSVSSMGSTNSSFSTGR